MNYGTAEWRATMKMFSTKFNDSKVCSQQEVKC